MHKSNNPVRQSSNKIAIAVIHYHLRPGGVTRVMERTVESLNNEVDMLCFSGEAPAPNAQLTPITEPFAPLAYGSNPSEKETEKLIDDLRFTARCLLGRDPDIWHIHNHSLGKNSFTPRLVWHLANAGCRLLLQPHDFAEDGRSKNYEMLKKELGNKLQTVLYPKANHVWYGPINYRDKSFLENIGLPNVYELPNAVTAQKKTRSSPTTKTIVYPARAIRRKNIGEFLLWSLLAPEGYTFQSTLAPQNPTWQRIYNNWVDFANELNLPVEFDAGRKHDFETLVQNAEALITTSIQEGFGLAFLEPWLEGKMLIGRNIPEITTDFANEGLNLSSLYNTLPVPVEWADKKQFHEALDEALKSSCKAYSKPWTENQLHEAKALLVIDGKVDFGILNENLQRNVIRHLVQNPDDQKQLPAFNPDPSSALIEKNRKSIQSNYSPKVYGDRLFALYNQLAAIKPGPVASAPAGELLNQFLQPHRVNLLRT